MPKGYTKDLELANWVRYACLLFNTVPAVCGIFSRALPSTANRNQRLEFANMQRGKKTRMTRERYNQLNGIGFVWNNNSSPLHTPPAVVTEMAVTGRCSHDDNKIAPSSTVATASAGGENGRKRRAGEGVVEIGPSNTGDDVIVSVLGGINDRSNEKSKMSLSSAGSPSR